MCLTLSIDDDAYLQAQTYADSQSLTLGQAVSQLIRRGTAEKLPLKQKNGAWVFALPSGTPKVTARQVQDMLGH